MVRRIDSPGQTEMPLTGTADAGPSISAADIETLVGRLRGAGWMTAGELAEQIGNKWTDRKVRKVASAAAPGVVSFPGSPGYKLWEECTVEEIDHCINALQSQARDMQQRAILYQNAFHARFRGGA